MKRLLLILSFIALFSGPFFVSAKVFSVIRPGSQDTINAVLTASSKTRVRPALLYGLFGQETAYGGYLGKTGSEWSNFCSVRNTEDCFNWRTYDCKADYRNARYFDEILKILGFTDAGGNVDRSQIPISSTCAIGFTQFEPNTWWETLRGKEQRVYNPWDVNDSVLMAAYYLQDIGADKNEILSSGEVIGSRDRVALQRYYCGGNYNRRECVIYANGVEVKARRAPVALLQAGLGDQLRVLEKERREIKRDIEKKFIKGAAQYVPPISCDGKLYTIPVQEGVEMALLEFKKLNRGKVEDLRREGLVSLIQEAQTNFVDGRLLSPDYVATYYGGTVVGTTYTSSYDPDLIRWFVFIHLADIEIVKSRLGEGFKIIPDWENRGPGSAIVEFRCGESLQPSFPPPTTLRTYPLLIEYLWPPNVKVGVPYSFKFKVTKESSPNVSWRVASGSLPPGLSLDSSGLISGTLQRGGLGGYDFVIEVRDDEGKTDTRPIFIVVEIPESFELLTIITTEIPEGFIGKPYQATLKAKGGTPPYTWEMLAIPPPSGFSSSFSPTSGLTIDPSSGILSGALTKRPLSSSLAVNVTDDLGRKDSKIFEFKVSIAPLSSVMRITNNSYRESYPAIIKRKNGDLIALFSAIISQTSAGSPGTFYAKSSLFSTVSRDDGKTWSIPASANNNLAPFKVIEDAQGNLVLFGLGSSNDDDRLSIFVSSDGQNWTRRGKVMPTKSNSSPYNIIQTKDGYYYALFSSGDVVDGRVDSSAYMTRSIDLVNWEESRLLVNAKSLASEPYSMQLKSGDFYLAYMSEVSTDGVPSWYLIVTQTNGPAATLTYIPALPPPQFASGPRLFEIDDKIIVFYSQAGENILKYVFLDGGALSEPLEVISLWTSPTNFVADFDLVLLPDNSFGIFYTEHVGEDLGTDAFFARLGKLNLSR